MFAKASLKVFLLIIVIAALWIFRFPLYPAKSKTVIMPDGTAVRVRLMDVRRVNQPGRVRIDLHISCADKKEKALFVPDMVITRPFAVQHPNCSGESCSLAYFDLPYDSQTIDIAQTLYYRKPADIVHVELPLTVHSVGRAGTARVEVLELGKGAKYAPGYWRPLMGDCGNNVPCDAFCVRVKQTDPDGSLMAWNISAAGLYSEWYRFGDSCAAELVDNRGRSIRMTGNFVAYRDCTRLESTTDTNPPKEKLRRKIVEAITLGHVHITGGSGVDTIMDVPGNGEWIYVFKVKDPSRYSKIRIKYLLPPKQKDRVTVRFNSVPI